MFTVTSSVSLVPPVPTTLHENVCCVIASGSLVTVIVTSHSFDVSSPSFHDHEGTFTGSSSIAYLRLQDGGPGSTAIFSKGSSACQVSASAHVPSSLLCQPMAIPISSGTSSQYTRASGCQ